MHLIEAAAWGMAGGLAAALLSLSAAVVAAGFTWPWRADRDGMWPRLSVTAAGLVIGALAAVAAAAQISGWWPAFLLGLSVPSAVRGALWRVEVTERKGAIAGPAEPDDHGA